MSKVKRLFKVAKELNVGTTMLVDHLVRNGHHVENSPNTKIPGELYDLLLKEFASDKQMKERGEQIVEKRNEERFHHTTTKPEPPKPPKEEETPADFMSAAQLRASANSTTNPLIEPVAKEVEKGTPPAEELEKNELAGEGQIGGEDNTADHNNLRGLKVIGKIDISDTKEKKQAPLVEEETSANIMSAAELRASASNPKYRRKRREKYSIAQIINIHELIDFAIAEQILSLELKKEQCTELPRKFSKLVHLESLSLRNCELNAIPSQIFELSNLRHLDLGHNKIKTVPSEIGQLVHLKQLKLEHNLLKEIPKEVQKLTTLQLLSFHNNQLRHLPDFIGQLEQLEILNLGNNRLNVVPQSIKYLKRLKKLDLYENNIPDLPKDICKLPHLKILTLDSNLLTKIPSEIQNLVELEKLDLGFNQLKKLPKEIENLTNLTTNQKIHEEDRGLNLEGNNFNIPDEIYTKEPNEIFQFIIDLQEGTKKLSEAKVIFVGSGDVGKTSLTKKLISGSYDSQESPTHGVAIKDWDIKYRNKPILLHMWDFGGQEIMHATHKFFMTRRSIYVLVINSRNEDSYERSNLQYWLRLIASYGGDSPIIVVQNKCDQFDSQSFGFKQLKEENENIVAFVKTSCSTGEGIEELEKLIKKTANNLDHVDDRVPAFYLEIKKHITKKNKDYLQFPDFKAVCQRVHPDLDDLSLKVMVGLFHDLGLMLNFKDYSSKTSFHFTHVLNPSWVTKGVYAIVTSDILNKQKGVIDLAQVQSILSKEEYPTIIEQNFIMEMMEYFELCYQIPEEQEKYFVPGVFPLDPPEELLPDYQNDEKLRFQIKHDYLSKNVIARFIVKVHNLIQEGKYWRNGVIIEKLGCIALIRAIPGKKVIQIEIVGEGNRREVLSILRDYILTINEKIKGSNPCEQIPLDDFGKVSVDYETLLDLENMGDEEIYIKELKAKKNVKELLNGVSTSTQRKEEFLADNKFEYRNNRYKNRKKNILFIGVNPEDTSRVRIDLEISAIKKAIKDSRNRDDYNLDQEFAVTLTELQSALWDSDPYIVHIAGHGDQAGRISFETNGQAGKYENIEKWANLFEEAKKVKCVVLNACYSDARAKTLLRYVDFVIGMPDILDDETAKVFSEGFYKAIASGGTIEDAFNTGLKRLNLADLKENAPPVLRKRNNINK